MNMSKKIICFIVLFYSILFFSINVEALACKYVDENGNLELIGNDYNAHTSVFWNYKENINLNLSAIYNSDNLKDKTECPKYALAVVSFTESLFGEVDPGAAGVFYSESKKELENKANEKNWLFDNPYSVELSKIKSKDFALIGFLVGVGTPTDENSQRVCSYDESDLGCENCGIDITFNVPKSIGTDFNYNINIINSYNTEGKISKVVIDEEQWKVKVKSEGQGDYSYISPVKNLGNFCPANLHFKYDSSQETLYVYPNIESEKNNDHNSDIDVNIKTDPTIVGDGFCGEDSTRRVLSLVGIILMIAKVLVPLIIIVIGSIDLLKAVMSKDEKDLMKSIKSIGLRLLAGIFIFFVPTIVDVVIDLVRDGHNENQCVECVLNPLDCRE